MFCWNGPNVWTIVRLIFHPQCVGTSLIKVIYLSTKVVTFVENADLARFRNAQAIFSSERSRRLAENWELKTNAIKRTHESLFQTKGWPFTCFIRRLHVAAHRQEVEHPRTKKTSLVTMTRLHWSIVRKSQVTAKNKRLIYKASQIQCGLTADYGKLGIIC